MLRTIHRRVALCLAVALWHAYSPAAFAETERLVVAGDLSAYGRVLLDGSEVLTGTTFFPGSKITTDEEARAILGLGALGRVEVLPHSSLVLGFGESTVSGALDAGGVRLSKPAGVAATITTGGGSVVAEPKEPAVFTIWYEAGRTRVETQTGKVQLHLKDREVSLGAGEGYAEAQNAPAVSNSLSGGKKAGTILAIGVVIALVVIIIAARGGDNNTLIVSPSR